MSNNGKPAAPPVKPTTELPTLTLFGMHKRGGKWIAVAVRTQGQVVLKTRVLEADPYKAHVREFLDRAMFRLYDQDVDPFEEDAA